MSKPPVERTYNPPANRVDDLGGIHDLIERAAFGHVISQAADGLSASGLPLLLDRSSGDLGALRGHFARANAQWRHLDGTDVLVLFPLADGYASPAWYPSKLDNPQVVPTWNYEVVHVHGVARIRDDADWVHRVVTELTRHHESLRSDGAPAWEVGDAPAEFIARQLRAIVGVEIEISHLDAKRKLSQNRGDDDRLGVIAGHAATGTPSSDALAEAMHRTDGWDHPPTS
jgi:transcriptional regulator